MGILFKKLFLGVLLAINSLIGIAFLICSYASYLDPKEFWYTGFLGLFFPYFLFSLVFFLVFWLFIRIHWALLSLAVLIIGYQSIIRLVPLNAPQAFELKKKEGDLRVMTWNVRHFIPFDESRFKPDGLKHKQQVIDEIRQYQPDVICFQEFVSMPDDGENDPFAYLRDKLGYRYYQFAGTDIFGTKQYSGIAIFSRYPILDGNAVPFPDSYDSNAEAPVYADVKVGEDTVRVFSVHLQSFGFKQDDYQAIDDLKRDSDKEITESRKLLSKMKQTFYAHGQQANYIRDELNSAPHPVVLVGDLNDVVGSYAYSVLKDDRRDAFLERGFGLGATFLSSSSMILRLLPTLRIDYIFHSGRYGTRQFVRDGKRLSDHYYLVADLSRAAVSGTN